jgi:hypothetical protein
MRTIYIIPVTYVQIKVLRIRDTIVVNKAANITAIAMISGSEKTA